MLYEVITIEYALAHDKPIHFLGLLSDGGVHSHTSHLRGLIDAAQAKGVQKMFVHAFTDGRDVDPKSGIQYVEEFEKFTQHNNAKLAYDLIVNGEGEKSRNAVESIAESYLNDSYNFV